MFDATEGAVELDEPDDPLGEQWDLALGLCARCGDVVHSGDAMHRSRSRCTRSGGRRARGGAPR